MAKKRMSKEDRLEEKVSPGLHKKIKKKLEKGEHKLEHKLEEQVAPGVHRKVKKLEKKEMKKIRGLPLANKKHKKKYSKKAEKKIHKVMKEFDKGKLHSGSQKGPVVENTKQAIAIGISEARKKGLKVGKRKKKK